MAAAAVERGKGGAIITHSKDVNTLVANMMVAVWWRQDLKKVAAAAVERAEEELAREAEEDGELRRRHGAAWNRPSSSSLNASLREKAAGYRCASLCNQLFFFRFPAM